MSNRKLVLVPMQRANGKPEQLLLCCHCSSWTLEGLAMADVEGAPFKAYYCAACAKAAQLPTDIQLSACDTFTVETHT